MSKFLNETGLAYYEGKIKERLNKKANAEDVPTKTSQIQNDSGFITSSDVPKGAVASSTAPKMSATTASVGSEEAFARGDHIHPTDTSRLATTGDGSNVTVSFNTAATREALTSGDSLAVTTGKIAKALSDLGDLAYKDSISTDQLDTTVKASLAKADSALQSYTETDPTVPSWAKAATKPTYTAAEVGAIPASDADTFAKKTDIANVYKYKGTVATEAELPSSDNTSGDVYNVDATDMNYAWNGTKWDPLGQMLQIDSITNAEIDAILAS